MVSETCECCGAIVPEGDVKYSGETNAFHCSKCRPLIRVCPGCEFGYCDVDGEGCPECGTMVCPKCSGVLVVWAGMLRCPKCNPPKA